MNLGRIGLAVLRLCLACAGPAALAQSEAASRPSVDLSHPDEPVHLIIGYTARPADRVAFRSYLEHAEAAWLRAWRSQGVITDYQILFMGITRFNDDVDAVITLTFPNYLGTYKWVDIEKAMPGGLAPEGLRLGAPKWSVLADRIAHGEAAVRHPAEAAYEVGQYEFADEVAYRKFATDYPAKMFANWLGHGALSSYSIYMAQNAEGGPWDSFIILEFTSRAAYAHSAEVKIRGYRELAASDPAWAAASKIRVSAKRKTHECFYTSLAAPGGPGRD